MWTFFFAGVVQRVRSLSAPLSYNMYSGIRDRYLPSKLYNMVR
jgi:hypothetical protein